MHMSLQRITAILMAPALALGSPVGLAGQVDGSTATRQWEEIVVVGSHLPRPAREVGSAVSVLDAADIRDRKLNQAAELLRQVPGLAVNRGGQEGAVTQVRIRGAEGNHTLVLIDGIEANDPFLGEFNFADLLSWDIGRIEVLRGPQSALYGSEAIGGVVNVATRAPQAGLSAHAELEGGTFDTSQLGASVSAAGDRLSALLSATRYQTDGISASAQPGENERDGYDNTTVHGKLDVALTPALDLRLVLRRADNEVENDGQNGGLVVDSDARTESEQLFALVELNGRLLGDRWLHRLAYGHTDSQSDNLSADALTSGSRGERDKLEYETTLRFGDDVWSQALTAGIEHEDLAFDYDSPSFPAATQSRTDEQTSYIGEYALTYHILGERAARRQRPLRRCHHLAVHRLAAVQRPRHPAARQLRRRHHQSHLLRAVRLHPRLLRRQCRSGAGGIHQLGRRGGAVAVRRARPGGRHLVRGDPGRRDRHGVHAELRVQAGQPGR
jgi:vitamin B12 transporter